MMFSSGAHFTAKTAERNLSLKIVFLLASSTCVPSGAPPISPVNAVAEKKGIGMITGRDTRRLPKNFEERRGQMSA